MSGLMIHVPMETTRTLNTSFIPFYNKAHLLGYFIAGDSQEKTLINHAVTDKPFNRRGSGDSMTFLPGAVKISGKASEALRLPMASVAAEVNPACTFFLKMKGIPKNTVNGVYTFAASIFGSSATGGSFQANKLAFSMRITNNGTSLNFSSGAAAAAPLAANNVAIGDVADSDILLVAASRDATGRICVEVRVKDRVIQAAIEPASPMPAVPDDMTDWLAYFGVVSGNTLDPITYQRGAVYDCAMLPSALSALLDRESVV